MFKLKYLSLFADITLISLVTLVCGCNNPQKTDNKKQETKQIKLVEETPNIYTDPDVTKNIGRINYDSNSGLPKSNNKTTLLRALAKLVKAKPKSNKITINYYCCPIKI